MAGKPRARIPRRDVIETAEPALAEALMKHFARDGVMRTPSQRRPKLSAAAEKNRRECETRRERFVEPESSDPKGYERIIGKSDLTSINYLDRGRRTAEAVCRIRVPSEGGEWCGTGFLVGPRLLVTNNHVLGNADEASRAEAEFRYEHDVEGVLKRSINFNLAPHEIFYTNAELDVTFVSVSPLADDGSPLDRFGWLPLLPESGKAVDGEWVTIIQHPNGGPKQIAIRSNQIVVLPDDAVAGLDLRNFLHYLTDTEPGSSGAPVLNDQWQVVALHHKAVPAPTPKGPARKKAVNDAAAEPEYIGNEGVRISAIYWALEGQRFEDPNAGRVLQRLESAFGLPIPPAPAGDIGNAESTKAFPATRWSKAKVGYDPDFLSTSIPFDPIWAKRAKEAAPLLKGKGNELKYNHFSVVIDKDRKFAMLTAVNIIGDKVKNLPRSDKWRRDPRIADEYQPDDKFYTTPKDPTQRTDKVAFARGHLVRRLDPCWGDAKEADAGEQDSFHFTNSTPQVQKYNDEDWGNLEDYVLARAIEGDARMTVFTGPIFRRRDPLYGKKRPGGPWQIPLSFWKIAVLQKTKTQIAAAAFIVGQTQYVSALYEAKVFSGLKPYKLDDLRSRHIQTTIRTVEKQTGLDFGTLKTFDAHGSLEATRQTRWVNGPDDILI